MDGSCRETLLHCVCDSETGSESNSFTEIAIEFSLKKKTLFFCFIFNSSGVRSLNANELKREKKSRAIIWFIHSQCVQIHMHTFDTSEKRKKKSTNKTTHFTDATNRTIVKIH